MYKIKEQVEKMTLKEKVGQLFMIGFSGKKLTGDIKEMIERYHIGGVIYFKRNLQSPSQAGKLSNGLQKLATTSGKGIPLFISTDQEGGVVTRLQGSTHFPGQMALGSTRNEKLAERTGKIVAREIKSAGINMNLAPVLDVNNNPDNPVIGVRSFGEDPELVSRMAIASVKGMKSEGIISCVKHFPGHGDTEIDSHLGLATINFKRERLERIELYPFRRVIENGIDFILAVHACYPAYEKKQGIPATLSAEILTGLLRKELGYSGLIISDCMEMKAVADNFGTVEGSIMAVEAGCDMVLISHTVEKARQAIENLIFSVEMGRIPEKRIDWSLERILKLKQKRLKNPFVKEPGLFNLEEGRKTAYSIARNAVTLAKDDKHFLPLKKEAKVLVCDFEMNSLILVENNTAQRNLLVDYLREEGMTVEHQTLNNKQSKIPQIDKYDIVVVCTYNAGVNREQLTIIRRLRRETEKILVLAVSSPYDLRLLPDIKAHIAIYDYSPFNFRVAAEVISGKIKAAGKLPVTIEES